MKIDVPKIIKQIDLKEYAAEMETSIDVWVNPPRAMLMEFYRLRALAEALPQRLAGLPEVATEERQRIGDEINAVGEQMADWHAAMWSQGKDEERHWSAEEVKRLMEAAVDTDPMLFLWLMVQTQKLIATHRNDIKKG